MTALLAGTYMLFVVFQCIKNVLAQFETVESNTVSKHIKSTTVRHDVAFNPGTATNRCFRVFVIMQLITPPKSNILNAGLCLEIWFSFGFFFFKIYRIQLYHSIN